MVFSSLPIYLDPPNWNQQAPGNPPQVPSMMPDSPQQPVSAGQARPVSMAERARLAKIPQPEQALKCPRCDSTNTKFCYFNNYSLSQPRHFCKTCRRYWTRGGALRNVPVGGGCRRNKRSKASSSASKQAGSSAPTSMGPAATLPTPPFVPFPFHHLSDFAATNIALGFNPMDSVDYQIGSGGGLEQWRIQQIQQLPFAGSIDPSSAVAGLFPFDGDSEGFSGCRPLSKSSSAGLISQLASVKMEDSSQGIQLQRAAQYLGAGNDQYWSGNGDAAVGNGCGWLGDLSGNIL